MKWSKPIVCGIRYLSKKWAGPISQSRTEREIDQFDHKHAMHMLYIEEGKVLGYQRMLPSTRPHLLSDVMPELCEVERPVGLMFGGPAIASFKAIAIEVAP